LELLGPLFRWEAVELHLSDRARIQGMLDFEAALARAEAGAGVIPASAAPAIVRCCAAERFDEGALAHATARAGNPAIPLVQQLTALVEKDDPGAARFVHWGATSQDAMDTGLVLQLRETLGAIETELDRLADVLATLADRHRGTPLAGRTWMQQAAPTTFGLKAAGWLDAVERHRVRLRDLRASALVLQLGGAVGTLAALGDKGLEVAEALAAELGLALPALPWHAHRDRFATVATVFGLGAGTLGKIARDVSLHAQTEVAELFEPEAAGRGRSSTLPHKQNPVASAVVIAAATRIPGLVATMLSAIVQEDERGLGSWHAEWNTLPEILSLYGGALHSSTEALAGLRVDAARMERNLELSRGLVFAEAVQTALAPKTGRPAAQRLVEAACVRARSQGRHLRDVLADDAEASRHLSREELASLFEPRLYLGVSDRLIERVLAGRRSDGSAGSGGS
jgi:3-carboxy-cis,cis-muconate cycloisomerase